MTMSPAPPAPAPPSLRPLLARLGPISRADGSAHFSVGRTTILSGVYGPVGANPQRELIDRAIVEVVYRAKVGPPSGAKERALEALIRGTVEEAVLTTLHPRTAVHLSLQQLEDAGGELACCVNAACLALMDAALPMRSLFAGVHVAVDEDGKVWLDPDAKEAKGATANLTFVFESTKKDILASHVSGKCSEKKFQECLSVARSASEAVFQFYRESLERKFSKELVPIEQ